MSYPNPKHAYPTLGDNTHGEYIPSKVWEYEAQGGKFGGTNRPTAGSRDDVELPRGSHALQLYSLGTPNGVKVTILLEELNLRYGVEYDAFTIKLTGEQFGKGFTAANPNSKIPALLHYADGPDAPPVRVFESAAILMYLCEHFDTDHVFLPDTNEPALRAECLSWLFFVQGSAPFVGGGFGHFFNYAPVKIKYAIDRYTMETKRQLDVLNRRLGKIDGGDGGPYLCGEKYTIADVCAYPWYGVIVEGKLYSGSAEFLAVHEYEHVLEWANLMSKRLACHRGKMVNRIWGDSPDEQLHERHSVSDFETKRALL